LEGRERGGVERRREGKIGRGARRGGGRNEGKRWEMRNGRRRRMRGFGGGWKRVVW